MTSAAKPLSVGAVVFPGFELLDLFGPLEFSTLLTDRFAVQLLAQDAGPIITRGGLTVMATRAFCDVADLDILLIPGGPGTRTLVNDADFIGPLRQLALKATTVVTVCTGSALIARTGLLDQRKATTNKRAFAWVAAQGPHVRWQPSARWVQDGRFFTSSGVSAGLDVMLAVIADLLGPDAAQDAANQAEYLWNQDPTNDPFTIAQPAGPHP